MPDPTGNAPAAPEAKKPIAPIPPKVSKPEAQQESQAAPAAPIKEDAPEKHDERPRDEQGRFTALEALDADAQAEDPRDFPKFTLDGMPSEELDAPRPKVTRKQRAKDVFSEVLGEDKVLQEQGEGGAAPEPGKEGEEGTSTPTPPPSTESEPAPKKITMFGREWDSQEQLEQEWKTYTGRYKKTVELEAAAKAERDRARSYADNAEQWRKAYEALAASKTSEPVQGTPANAPANGAVAKPENGDEPLNGINWDAYKVIREQHGEGAATLWVVEEALKAERKKVAERFDELTRPQKEQAELNANAFAAGETMRKLADEWPGQFPEFEDQTAVDEMGQFFLTRHAEGIPWSYLKSPRGVYETVLAHRAWRAEIGNPMGSAAPSAPPKPDAIQQAVESVRQANQTLSGRSAPLRSAPPNESQGQRVKRAILGAPVSSEFGWEA